jgi:hypothetical protein
MQAKAKIEIPELEIVPSSPSSYSDFDFFFGKWKIQNRKLRERLTNCTEWDEFDAVLECHSVLNGFGNTDTFKADVGGEHFEGMTLRLFDPNTRLWSIYWASTSNVVLDVPQVGSFDGKTGEFLARDVWNETPIIVKFLWDKTAENAPTWSQAFSADEGKTWEWNWYMYMLRLEA